MISFSAYYFYGLSAQKRFEAKLDEVFEQWKTDWVNRDAGVELVSVKGNVFLESCHNAVFCNEDIIVNCDQPDKMTYLVVGLAEQKFAYEDTELFQQLTLKASTAIIHRLVDMLCDQSGLTDSDQNIKKTPYVHIKIQFQGAGLNIYLSSDWMQRCFPLQIEHDRMPALQSTQGALAPLSAQLSIKAGQIKVSLQELNGLKPGDILKTNHSATAALAVLGNDHRVFTAYLGVSEGMKVAVIDSIQFNER